LAQEVIKVREFILKSEFIELDNMLKALKLAASGAEAKEWIQSGRVKVNGAVESRVRRKLRLGDSVGFDSININIVVK
jgi:ribosome-associated protein